MKAFTLIEVMISLFILLVGMTGVIKLQATSVAITKLSGDLTYAQSLAQTALQRQMSRPVSKATLQNTCLLDDTAALSNTKNITYKGIKYTITCNITKNKSPMLSNKKIGTASATAGFIKVKVSWTDLLGNNTINKHEVFSYGILTTK